MAGKSPANSIAIGLKSSKTNVTATTYISEKKRLEAIQAAAASNMKISPR